MSGLPPQEHAAKWREELRRPSPPRERRKIGGRSVELVVDDERVDKAYENEQAKLARERTVEERKQKLEDRNRQRSILPVGARLDLALRMLTSKVGGLRSRPIAAARPGSNDRDGGGPPRVDDTVPEVEQRVTLIRHHLSAIEQILDAEDGLLRVEGTKQGFYGTAGHAGGVGAARMLTTEERDRIVFDDFQGVRSEVVTREAPYLGTGQRTIERARVNEARRRGVRVRPVDGVILGEKAA